MWPGGVRDSLAVWPRCSTAPSRDPPASTASRCSSSANHTHPKPTRRGVRNSSHSSRGRRTDAAARTLAAGALGVETVGGGRVHAQRPRPRSLHAADREGASGRGAGSPVPGPTYEDSPSSCKASSTSARTSFAVASSPSLRQQPRGAGLVEEPVDGAAPSIWRGHGGCPAADRRRRRREPSRSRARPSHIAGARTRAHGPRARAGRTAARARRVGSRGCGRRVRGGDRASRRRRRAGPSRGGRPWLLGRRRRVAHL